MACLRRNKKYYQGEPFHDSMFIIFNPSKRISLGYGKKYWFMVAVTYEEIYAIRI